MLMDGNALFLNFMTFYIFYLQTTLLREISDIWERNMAICKSHAWMKNIFLVQPITAAVIAAIVSTPVTRKYLNHSEVHF